MFEKITVRLFLICLVSCASLVLFVIWTSGPDSPSSEIYMKTAVTLFIIGLASFLSWFVSVLYSVRDTLRS